MYRVVLVCGACLMFIGMATPPAHSLAPFKKSFQEKYVKKSDSEEFKALFKKTSCYTCHVKGKKKSELNPYGLQLSKLIEGDAGKRIKQAGQDGDDAKKAETAKVLKELAKAFETVSKMKTKAGPTHGQLIKEHQLPPI